MMSHTFLKMSRALIALFLLFSLNGCKEDSPSDWAGLYSYKNPASEYYELTLYDDGQCQLSIQGENQNLIICNPTFQSNKVRIEFSLYAPAVDVAQEPASLKTNFKTGNTLFEIERQGTEHLLTHWKTLIPEGTPSNSGDFFVKRS